MPSEAKQTFDTCVDSLEESRKYGHKMLVSLTRRLSNDVRIIGPVLEQIRVEK